jgi:hypothetical protein
MIDRRDGDTGPDPREAILDALTKFAGTYGAREARVVAQAFPVRCRCEKCAREEFSNPGTFEVFGSYGTLTVCARTGAVLSLNKRGVDGESDEYADIKGIDVAEYSRFCPALSRTDIVMVGFWDNANKYTPPEHTARAEYLRALAVEALPLYCPAPLDAGMRRENGAPCEHLVDAGPGTFCNVCGAAWDE